MGAGTGATVGKLNGRDGWCKGGLGGAGATLLDGATVAVLAVVNAFGDVLEEDGQVLAGAFDPAIGFVRASQYVLVADPAHPRLAEGQTPTLICVATDAALTKVEAGQIARMTQAGVARAVSPINTPLDGDTVFCLSIGARSSNPFVVGVVAAELAATAVRDGVRNAVSVRGVPTGPARETA